MTEDYSFDIVTDAGEKVTCDTLAIITPEGDNDEDTFIIYTDYTMDEDRNFNVYASKLVLNGEDFILEEIDDIDRYKNILIAVDEEYRKLNYIEN